MCCTRHSNTSTNATQQKAHSKCCYSVVLTRAHPSHCTRARICMSIEFHVSCDTISSPMHKTCTHPATS